MKKPNRDYFINNIHHFGFPKWDHPTHNDIRAALEKQKKRPATRVDVGHALYSMWFDGKRLEDIWATPEKSSYPIGASLFWLPRAMKQREIAIADDLDFLREGPFTFARIWHVKDYEKRGLGRTWPTDPGHWGHIEKSYEVLEEHGLKAMSTLFAGGSQQLTQEERKAYVDQAMFVANRHRDTIWCIEIFNEFHTKGISEGEVRELGQLAASLTDIPIALSAVRPPDDDSTKGSVLRDLYGGLGDDFLITHHANRRNNTEDGDYRMVRQGWHHQFVRDVPRRWIESEPGGSGSSGVSYTNPIVIGAHAANVAFMGGSGYVLHGDWWAGESRIQHAKNMPQIIKTLELVSRILPMGLETWPASSHNAADHPLQAMENQRALRRFVRAYARLSEKEDWVCIIGASGPLTLAPSRRSTMDLWDLHKPTQERRVITRPTTLVSPPQQTSYLVRCYD